MILAHRPPISIPRTNISPALLDELISEMSSLASVYHKPAGTFIGLGRIGADSVQKKEECVYIDLRVSIHVGSHPRPLVCWTTDSPHRRRCKLSQRANRPRTSSTSTMSPQINRLAWPLRKSPPLYLQPQTLSRELHQTPSTILSPSSVIWAPLNRH